LVREDGVGSEFGVWREGVWDAGGVGGLKKEKKKTTRWVGMLSVSLDYGVSPEANQTGRGEGTA